jgi:hypothetical protein
LALFRGPLGFFAAFQIGAQSRRQFFLPGGFIGRFLIADIWLFAHAFS